MSDRDYNRDYRYRGDRYDRQGQGQGGGRRRDYHDSRRGEYDHWGGGGGGSYNRRGSGGSDRQQPHRYQSSYVGHKRARDEPEAPDPKKQFIQRLMRLGEPGQLSEADHTNTGDTAEKTLENSVWALKQEIKHRTEDLEGILVEAAVSCSPKTVHYALLLGLLHSENPDWVASFVAAAGQRFAADLAAGEVAAPRLLLRLFACLTLTGVLHPADVLGLMGRLVEVAAAQAAGGDTTGLTWQPWADQLVYAVMASLVWGGRGLATAAPAEHAQVMEAIAAYMAARPLQEYSELRPMYGAANASDAAATSDSGGASFLSQLWAALQELADPSGLNWRVEGVPHQLVDAMAAKLKGAPVELPPLDLPQAPPVAAAATAAAAAPGSQEERLARAEAAVALQDRYPARGGMFILDRQYTDGKRAAIERFVAEEYMIDCLAAFDSHRVELARMLCSGLPLPYDYSGLLCETLFAQLLRLPRPRLSPVAFSALIAHAALLRPAFPKYLAGSVRQLYLRLQFLDPELGRRLADVLAHFITNMNFRWPWDKYRSGLSQPPGGPQRSFLVLVLQHLVRLTSWDHAQLLQETPAEFLALLGEQPHFTGLPTPEVYPAPAAPPAPPALPGQAAPAAAGGGDADMPDAAGGAAEPAAADTADAGGDSKMQEAENGQQQPGGDGQAQQQEGGEGLQQAMEVDAGAEQQQQQQAPPDPVLVWAGRLLAAMQSRPPPERKTASLDQVQQWIAEHQVFDQLDGPEAQLRALALAVLAAGSKSCSHCYVMLERFSPLLLQLLEAAGRSRGELLLLELLGQTYGQMPTRLALALARLHELGLVSPLATVAWLTSPELLQLAPAPHEPAALDAWLLLDATLEGISARHEGASEQRQRLAAAVAKAEGKLRAAAEESAAAAAEAQRHGDDTGEGGGGGSRQAIVWPGGGGGGGGRRLELAAMREEVMARKLNEAEAAATEQEDLVVALEAERGAALLEAFKAVCRRLADAGDALGKPAAAPPAVEAAAGGEGAEGAEGAEQQAGPEAAAAQAESARQLCLAQVRGFSRAWRSRLVQLGLAQQLLEYADELQLQGEARAALLGPLHL